MMHTTTVQHAHTPAPPVYTHKQHADLYTRDPRDAHIQSRGSTVSSLGVVTFERPGDKIQTHREAILKYHLEHRGTVNRQRVDAGPNSDDVIRYNEVPYRLKAFQLDTPGVGNGGGKGAVRVPRVPTGEFASMATSGGGAEDIIVLERKSGEPEKRKLAKVKDKSRIDGVAMDKVALMPKPARHDGFVMSKSLVSPRIRLKKLPSTSSSRKEVNLSATSLPGIANLKRRRIQTNKSTNSVDKLPDIEPRSSRAKSPSQGHQQSGGAEGCRAPDDIQTQMWVMGLSFSGDDEANTARREYFQEMIARKKVLADDKSYDVYARKKNRSNRRTYGFIHWAADAGTSSSMSHGIMPGQLGVNDSKSLDAGVTKEDQSVLSFRSARTLPRLGHRSSKLDASLVQQDLSVGDRKEGE